MRLWTSGKLLQGNKKSDFGLFFFSSFAFLLCPTLTHFSGKIEFCSILNNAIRTDLESVMEPVATFCRGMNSLCVDRRVDKVRVEWPADHLLYRGASLPDDQRHFWVAEKQYRCPMYLATSKNKIVSQKTFCRRATEMGLPPVLYVIHLHPDWGCLHVNYVDRTNIPGEDEFLFVPYSVFKVRSTEWKTNPTWLDPHIIHLDADPDNKLCPEDLPLCFWHWCQQTLHPFSFNQSRVTSVKMFNNSWVNKCLKCLASSWLLVATMRKDSM